MFSKIWVEYLFKNYVIFLGGGGEVIKRLHWITGGRGGGGLGTPKKDYVIFKWSLIFYHYIPELLGENLDCLNEHKICATSTLFSFLLISYKFYKPKVPVTYKCWWYGNLFSSLSLVSHIQHWGAEMPSPIWFASLLISRHDYRPGNGIIATMVFWEYLLQRSMEYLNIHRIIFEYSSNDIGIFEQKIFEYLYLVHFIITNLFVFPLSPEIDHEYLYSYSC